MSLAVYWFLLETRVQKTRLASNISICIFQAKLCSFLMSECSTPSQKIRLAFLHEREFLIQLTIKGVTSNSVSFSSVNELGDLLRNQISITRLRFLARFR